MERDEIVRIARARYGSKRAVGISDVRKDGSRCSVDNDIDSTGAEVFAAEMCHEPFDSSISTSGDRGYDFKVNGRTVKVVWLGRNPNGTPRKYGNLIVNPHEPKRWADFYVVVSGGLDEGYRIAGWMSHKSLVARPLKDFGFGDRFSAPVSELTPHRDRFASPQAAPGPDELDTMQTAAVPPPVQTSFFDRLKGKP